MFDCLLVACLLLFDGRCGRLRSDHVDCVSVSECEGAVLEIILLPHSGFNPSLVLVRYDMICADPLCYVLVLGLGLTSCVYILLRRDLGTCGPGVWKGLHEPGIGNRNSSTYVGRFVNHLRYNLLQFYLCQVASFDLNFGFWRMMLCDDVWLCLRG